ncbi:PREDICTED: pre-rRNA-processing protein ESF1-like, partial [Rhagoletis zephyria]|uniref:pre-rRNA-processing protein ESF1-like n=1 Tax=Rhagoletis zephyria TaxID=28612 RepID=UPI0008117804
TGKMSKKEADDRFSKLTSDPRFRTYRKVDKKLKVDSRFKSMFTENKFKLKYSMDKRGKNKKHLISDDYKKFYRLSDEEDAEQKDAEQEKHETGDAPSTKEKQNGKAAEKNLEDKDEEVEPLAERKLTHKIEEATSRIAICNADWDRINAQDLFVLLNSFKKATGDIHYVRIYYSKFGEERLKVEEMKGPSEFIFGKATNIEEIKDEEEKEHSENEDKDSDDDKESDDSEDEEEEEEGDAEAADPKAVEKLRKYQLERLKYFYAVVEFDSPETAEVVYNELDGLEYETSSTTLDIRFVPEEMDFEDVKLKEECTSMPDQASYQAPNFVNSALQQSHVTLTWDETDHRRKTAFDKAFEKEGNEDDLKAYLATSSSEEEDDEVAEIDDDLKDEEKINKYKDLLKSLDKKDDDDVEMEVTWDPSLKANAENRINKKGGDASKASATNKPNDDDYSADSEDNDEEEEADATIEDNQDDQLVSSDSEAEKKAEKSSKDASKDKYKKWKKKRAAKKAAAEAAAKGANSEDASNLELLMVDLGGGGDKGDRKHFNYKEIVENYSKKGKSKDATAADQPKDSFKFDADDPRFGAIFTSHLYNVDQSDPSFKKTEAFDQILNKRTSKAAALIKDEKSAVAQMESAKPAKNAAKSWSSLANRVKSKAASAAVANDRKRTLTKAEVQQNITC